MKGLFIRKSNETLERVEKQGEVLSLLAKGDGVEIMHQIIREDEIFAISPGDNGELMEFFYILSGSATMLEDGRVLTKGCYFYAHHLEDTVRFRAIEETVMVYISSQPVFHLLSEEINELTSILKQVEEKDMCTYEHNNRLADYSMKIGKRINLSEERLDTLFYGAVFHDIGKINVPDEILKKPGRLSPQEFEFIKKHPTDGKDLVGKTYMNNVADVVEQHHERLNGTGYPRGLKGDQILTEAKIIAIVDSYDAMVSERPYKKGMPIKVVMDELKSLSGSHYDLRIMDTFEKILIEEKKL